MLTDREVIEHIHNFEEWRDHGKYITSGEYAMKAQENINILRKLRRKEMANPSGAAHGLFE